MDIARDYGLQAGMCCEVAQQCVPAGVTTLERALHTARVAKLTGLPILVSGGGAQPSRSTLAEMARQLFGPERRTRFRCDFFPFVEPGVDFAVDCAHHPIARGRLMVAFTAPAE